jgi:mannosyltransferase OCH1-like enzyme
MNIPVVISVVFAIVVVALGIKSLSKAHKRNKELALGRYEKVKNGELSESDLNEQEKELLQKLRAEKNCESFDASLLLLWAFIMHNHNVLPQDIVQTYEVDLNTNFPQVYVTYQQCYNSYCYYNSGGNYSGYYSC